jgi:hypothetical protein
MGRDIKLSPFVKTELFPFVETELSPYLTLEIVDSRTILAKICVAKMIQRGPPQIQHVNDQNPACDPGSYHMYANLEYFN